MSDDEAAGALWPALLTARRTSKGVEKTGRNQAQGWAFVTVEDVTREALRCLNEAGLVAVLCTGPPVDGLTQLDAWLHVVHAATGETIRFTITWPIARQNDQGLRAAYSYARKQALVELLMIAEPDDPETTVVAHASRPPQQVPKPPDPPEGWTPPTDDTPQVDPQKLKAMWAGLHTVHGKDDNTIRLWVATLLGIDPDWSSKQLTAGQVTIINNQLRRLQR